MSNNSTQDTERAHQKAELHKQAIDHILLSTGSDNTIKDTVLVMDQSFFLISSQLDEPTVTENQEYQDVTHFLLSRGMKTFWAIRCLILAGCDQDGMALSRNLSETEATLEYLVKTSVCDRMDRFRQFEHIERTKNANRHRQAGTEPAVRPDLLKLAETKRVELVERYGESYLQGWAGKNIEAMFREMDRSEDYNSHYSPGSLLTHATYLSRHQYKKTDAAHCNWLPTIRYARSAGLISLDCLIGLAGCYAKFHGVSGLDLIFAEINWNVISRFNHDGFKTRHDKFKDIPPVPPLKWGRFPKRASQGNSESDQA